jgi:lipopolysaccharide export system protein LptC
VIQARKIFDDLRQRARDVAAKPAMEKLLPAPGVLARARANRSRPKRLAYSRFVFAMKLFLPTVAFCLVVLVILWPQIHIDSSQFTLGFARLKLSGGESPSMVNARFVGTDRRNQPFTVTADLAKSASLGSSNVELEQPKADLGMNDGSAVMLTANSGLYDQSGKTLKLQGAVNLFHDSGYEFKTAAADVDFASGTASGTKPVDGQGPFGELHSEGFRIAGDGKRLLFTGKAKMTIFPAAKDGVR